MIAPCSWCGPADPRRGSPLRGPIRHLVDLRRLLPDDSTRLEADAMRAAHPRAREHGPNRPLLYTSDRNCNLSPMYGTTGLQLEEL